MKIMTIEFATDVMWTAPVEDLSSTWDRWEEYIKAKMADAPVGLKNGYQTSEAWAWMDTITQMKEGSYLAAATTLAIAGVTTMISSNNIFIALYSLLSILCILVTTIASVISMGWTLGFLEGICITILIGLSVDYVVHIGHAYASAMRVEGTTRKECARHALATMGFPVLSAALTSLAASLLLLGAVITFFTKFGTIVILSTIYATLTSTILLIALLAAAGPVNGAGDVKCLCRRRHQSATRHHQHGANML
jgi:multidrug efflux pump subunit AcrB